MVGKNYKPHDSHTREISASRSDNDSCARNLYEEHKNEEDEECIDHPSIKNDRIDSQSHEEIRKRLLFKKIIKSDQFGYV